MYLSIGFLFTIQGYATRQTALIEPLLQLKSNLHVYYMHLVNIYYNSHSTSDILIGGDNKSVDPRACP